MFRKPAISFFLVIMLGSLLVRGEESASSDNLRGPSAESQTSQDGRTSLERDDDTVAIKINPQAITLGGYEIDLEFQVSRRWTLGVFYGNGLIHGGDSESVQWDHYSSSTQQSFTLGQYGAKAAFYFQGFNSRSAYINAGLFSFTANQSVNTTQTYAPSQSLSNSWSGIGGLLAGGYRWVWFNRFSLQLGLGYEYSSALQFYPQITDSRGTIYASQPISALNFVFADLGVGVVF